MDCLLGCAGWAATNPLDVVKTRSMLGATTQLTGAMRGGALLRGLVKGLAPACASQSMASGPTFPLLRVIEGKGLVLDKEGGVLICQTAYSGSKLGAVATALANPFLLVKTRMQATSSLKSPAGFQHRTYGLFGTIVYIYKTENGLHGLYRGAASNVPAAFVNCYVHITAFLLAKRALDQFQVFGKNNKDLTTLAAASFGGALGGFLSSPLDLLVTRMHNQGLGRYSKGLSYDGYLDCVERTFSRERPRGFLRGGLVNTIRGGALATVVVALWLNTSPQS